MKMAALGILAAGAACALFAPADKAVSGMTGVGASGFRPVGDVASLDGHWRSRGYGWVVEIDDGEARFHDQSATYCVEREGSHRDLAEVSGRFEVSMDGRTLRVALEDPTYLYTFDRIAELPEACRRTPDTDPQAVLEALIDLFSTHYAFFTERNVDWNGLADHARRALSRAPSEERLLEVAGALVSSVRDAHVSLTAEIEGEREEREPQDGRTLALLAAQAAREDVSEAEMRDRWDDRYWDRDMRAILGRRQVHWALDDSMVYGLIGDDIGYIALATMAGYTSGSDGGAHADIRALDETMDEVLALFVGVDAVIVDISMNDGGYDMVARALAERFADERTLAYSKYAGDAEDDTPQAIYLEPSEGRRFTGPVYMLTSDYSMSAAEIFVMAMRALPNVTHLGQATRGTLSDELWKTLPNGWTLSLSNEVYLDADGELWEGTGIPPQIALEVFSPKDVTHGHLEAVRAIISAIRTGEPVGSTRS